MLWNRIWKPKQLKPGDHIYTWKGARTKPHHGVYINDEKVIHFIRGVSSAWSNDHRSCSTCRDQSSIHGVISSSIDCFRSGGDLYLFKYGVNPVLFLARPGWGISTCTLAAADRIENVERRANFLLCNEDCRGHHIFISTSYEFAIYCKTGLIAFDGIVLVDTNKQARSSLIFTLGWVLCILLRLMPANFTSLTALGLIIYSTCRLPSDIGVRLDAIQVEHERFNEIETIAEVVKTLTSRFLGHSLVMRCAFKQVSVALAFALIFWAFSLWYMTRPLIWGLAGYKYLYWAVYERTFEIQWLLSNKIELRQLEAGDHIYTWRNGYSYSHHGIYVGEIEGIRKVIHLTRGDAPLTPSWSISHNPLWGDQMRSDRVMICDLPSFLLGGQLYRYDYGVGLDFFIAKSRGGTGTIAYSSHSQCVLHRAYFLLEGDFGPYDLFQNNCEDFAVYCKTGLVPRFIAVGRSGQIVSVIAAISAFILSPYCFMLTSIGNCVGGVAVFYVLYSVWRMPSDAAFCGRRVGMRELASFDTKGSRQKSIRKAYKLIVVFCLIFWLTAGQPYAFRSQNSLFNWVACAVGMWVVFV